MEYRVIVQEVSSKENGADDIKEVYRQQVSNLNVPALIGLINDGRKRTRTRAEKKGGE